MQALLRAKANAELLDNKGRTALQWAEDKGHTAIAPSSGSTPRRRSLPPPRLPPHRRRPR